MTAPATLDTWVPEYDRWRHGGWYVMNLRYPSGAVGCVSRNYADRKWRIVCDPRPFDTAPTFPNRDAAARAERALAEPLAVAATTPAEAEAARLTSRWHLAVSNAEHMNRPKYDAAEQEAYDVLVEYVDSHDLTFTAYDPRGGTPDDPRGDGS